MGSLLVPLFRDFYVWNDLREPSIQIELQGSKVVVEPEGAYFSRRKARVGILREEVGKVANWGLRMGIDGGWYLTDEDVRELLLVVKDAGILGGGTCMSD